jgi:hypothetical protein
MVAVGCKICPFMSNGQNIADNGQIKSGNGQILGRNGQIITENGQISKSILAFGQIKAIPHKLVSLLLKAKQPSVSQPIQSFVS